MKRFIAAALSIGCISTTNAHIQSQQGEIDTTQITPIVITAEPNKFSQNNETTSFTLTKAHAIKLAQINNLHDFAQIAPNFYMPEYGTRGTSSIFVRGVGARMNEPSIAVYVDNIPYLDKSSFDFDFYDINSILLLRGPQSTLFGRNSIGGVMQIQTLSPFEFQGTRLAISYGNRNAHRYNIAHYAKLTEKIGVSFALSDSGDDGFFENETLGSYDKKQNRSARAKFNWQLPNFWTLQATVLYDNTAQNAFPYAQYDKVLEQATSIAYNNQGLYNREMISAGLLLNKKLKNSQFSSATSYQHVYDFMQMDQDYTADSLFKLMQSQYQNNITQEFTWRSTTSKPYSWIVGAFGFVKSNDIDAPVTLESGMMKTIQGHMDAAMEEARENNPRTPFVNLGNQINIPGTFSMNNYGAALYHQSELKFWENFTATVGLRLDVERAEIDYNTQSILATRVSGGAMPFPITAKIVLSALGNENETFVHLTPKFSLKYNISPTALVYATAVQGRKSGGYNYSMFSNVFQDALYEAKSQIKTETLEVSEDALYYKPESLWNFEIGSHFLLFNDFKFDIAAYYIRHSDMQIVSTLATNNGSRMIVNAGKSTNFGTEISAQWAATRNLNFNAQHGYTHATFDNFVFDGNNYSNNFVPFVPRNTLSAGVNYSIQVDKRLLNSILIAAQYSYFTNIYFTERNNVQEKFYDIVNASLTFQTKSLNYGLWVKNAFNRDYSVFYCESLGNGFVQQGKPLQYGFSISAQF